MLPTTFCAGMTLPLFTFIMLRQGCGEKSIGQIYAANTLGAITGVIFTIFIGMPILGLKGAILLGCSLDILLGLYLLSRSSLSRHNPVAILATISGITICTTVLLFDLDTWKMNSSVFRTGTIMEVKENARILFHKDAKTSSVSIIEDGNGAKLILTNGKPDASIIMDNSGSIAPDEITMTLAAALPLAINPDAKLIANIGMGSGLTTHTLLTWPGVQRVDTIEIEPAMVEAANHFRPRVEKAFTDPRSKIYFEDAKTYFSSYQKKYDLIISEPSNPWVSGVSSLFTDEFYHHIKNHISNEGIFVQWIQQYENNPQLFLSVLKALKNNFSNFALYAASDGDLIIIARNNKSINQPSMAIFNNAATKKELARIGIHNIQDIEVRFIADQTILAPLIDKYSPAINSDYFPYLDLNAARARFMQQDIYEIARIKTNLIPIVDILSSNNFRKETTHVSGSFSYNTIGMKTFQAQSLFRYLNDLSGAIPRNPLAGKLKLMATFAESCEAINVPMLWINKLVTLANLTVPYLSPDELHAIWEAITPKCENGLNDDQLNWLELIKALSQRNSELIAIYSSNLLNQGNHWNLQQQRIQFTAQMTALVKLKKIRLAQQLWKQHIARLYQDTAIPLPLLILDSLATQRNDKEITSKLVN